MPQLTPSQEKAIHYEDGDLTLLAGAGSGKTFVIVEKIAHLIREGKTSLGKLLVITFTEKAAQELKFRLSKRLELPIAQISKASIGTIHGFAGSQVRHYANQLELSPDFKILDDFLARMEKGISIREKLLELANAENESRQESSAEALDCIERFNFRKSIRYLDDLLSENTVEGSPYPHLLQAIQVHYDLKKKEKNFLDFQDLETYFLKLLQIPEMKSVLQNSYDWIFVDEFQDVSPIQWRIVSSLHETRSNRLIIVGDPRQSIYRFRGADPMIFDRVRHEIEKEKGQTIFLSENFRSHPTIIEFINRLQTHIFESAFPDLLPTRDDLEGDIETLSLTATKAEELRTEEAREVAERILLLHDEGYAFEEICLLFRTRLAVPFFEKEFKERDIPYQTSSGEALLERPEVVTLFHFMKKAEAALFSHSFTDLVLQNTPLANMALPLPDKSLSTFIRNIFEPCYPLFDEREQKNIKAFEDLLKELLKLGVDSLSSLVDIVQTLRDEEVKISCPNQDESPTGVHIMTVHASKGLEFKAVFVCDTSSRLTRGKKLSVKDESGQHHLKSQDEEAQGLRDHFLKDKVIEHLEEKEKKAEMEEAKRLLYVALTRATERLILPLPPIIVKSEKKKPTEPNKWSDFIHEALA